MSLSPEEAEALKRLKARLDASTAGSVDAAGRRRMGFGVLDSYYNGIQTLEQLGLAVPDDLRKFVTIVAWPGTQVDAIEERCDVEGFRLPGQPEADDGLAAVWQANELDDESQMGHVDSLVFGRSYVCVGAGELPELPLITVESPLEMVHEWSPRDRETLTAARFYADDSAGAPVARATLYTRISTVWLLQNEKKEWIEDPDLPRDNHNLGRCPVVPLINRARSADRYGTSEMGRIITLTDAAARALTNAQVATEVAALPQKYVAGMTAADFTDPDTGEMVTKWESYFGSVWATTSKDAKFGQFSAADLRNFETIISHYAQLVAGVTGLPMRYLGQLAANPPSADGIRADEARLVKTCERKSRSWGASWERVMRLAMQFQTGADDPLLASMETLWRDPATPTRAQSADAASKLFAQGISTKRQARIDVGYSVVQIANMEIDDAANPDPIGMLASELRNADRADPVATPPAEPPVDAA